MSLAERAKSQWIIEVQTTTAASYVDHTPAQGCIDKIVYACGYHDDVAARDCQWTLADLVASTDTNLDNAVSRAAAALHQLYEGVYTKEPLMLRYGTRLRFYIPALGAGKTCTAKFVIERIKGEDTYGG